MAITLDATTKILELTTSSTAGIDWVTSWVDMTTTAFTPGDANGTVNTATTTTIVAAPASSTQRGVKSVSIFNRHATAANTVTIKKDVSGTEYRLIQATLAAGESLQWSDGGEWQRFDATGRVVVNNVEKSVIATKPIFFLKGGAGNADSAGYWYCYSKDSGFPGAWSPGTPGVNGRTTAGTNSADAGCIPIGTPTGSLYISSVSFNATINHFFTLLDVVWVNTGLNVTTTGVQNITTPTLPARDNNGSSDGEGYMIWLLTTVANTNAAAISNTIVTYTNSDNTPSRTAVLGSGLPDNIPATPVLGTIVPFMLASGDKGVRSIQSITLNTSLGGGSVSLLIARPVISTNLLNANVGYTQEYGAPGIRVYNDSCLIWAHRAFTNSSTSIMGTIYFRDV